MTAGAALKAEPCGTDARASDLDAATLPASDFDPFEGGHSVPVFEWLLRTPGITPIDAIVYGKLAFFRGKGSDRECRPSIGRVARELGLHERECRKHVAKLERAGLIRRETRRGRANIFVFLDPGAKHPGVNDTGVNPPSVILHRAPRVKTTRTPRVKFTLQSEERREQVTEHRFVAASLSAEIERLESRYSNREITKSARQACARARSGGKMADKTWLRTLTKLDVYDPAVAEYTVQQFVGRYADGSKDEKYLLGIARRVAANPSRAAGVAPAICEAPFAQRVASEVICEH